MLDVFRDGDSFSEMSTAKSLSDEQVSQIRTWAEDGLQLPDIQKRLADELDVRVTYLETRFLLDDLGIELMAEEKEEPAEESAEDSPGPGEADAGDAAEGGESGGAEPEGDGASVTIDQVQRPGAIVSGRVSFAGGQSAAWWLDQMGRLGMDPSDPDFQPSEAQMLSFQQELQVAIQQSGL